MGCSLEVLQVLQTNRARATANGAIQMVHGRRLGAVQILLIDIFLY